jgi:hypothetical protein
MAIAIAEGASETIAEGASETIAEGKHKKKHRLAGAKQLSW